MFMDVLKGLPGGMPNIHVAVDLLRHGRRRRQHRRLRRDRRGQRNLPVHAARDLHGVAADRGRDLPVERRRRQANYTRRHLGGVLVHRRAGRDRLRLRAPVRVGVARARRRRRAGAGREPGLPAPRRAAGHHHGDQRGRLLGAAGRPALRHQLQHQSRRRSSGRPPTSAATSSVTSATALPPRKAPDGQVTATVPLQNCTSSECDGW